MVRCTLGFVTQEEEDWFAQETDSFRVDMEANNKYHSRYFPFNKRLTQILRRKEKKKAKFDSRGALELSEVFGLMGEYHPTDQMALKGAQFAAFLYASNKHRFMIDVHLKDSWMGNVIPPEEPFEVRMGCFQGHSNQASNPEEAHHKLTPIEARSLGWIYHVTPSKNKGQIFERGLLRMGRDAAHFMYVNDNAQRYAKKGTGTKPPRIHDRPVYCVLDPLFVERGNSCFSHRME